MQTLALISGISAVVFFLLGYLAQRRGSILILNLTYLAAPFCFIYNVSSGAVGSAIGDSLAMLSLSLALITYDLIPYLKSRKNQQGKD